MGNFTISPGVTLNELDKSYLSGQPIQVGAAIIGPTVKGPVEVPTVVTSYSEYKNVFGDIITSGSDVYSYFTSIAAYNNFNYGGQSLLVARVVTASANWSSAQSTTVTNYLNAESYNDYPDSVSNNAKRGIELNDAVNNKCATQVGKVRAQQLANKENLTIDTIQRMYSYLSRAETYYDESNTEACGTISYLLWGGKAGFIWSRKKLRELDLLNE